MSSGYAIAEEKYEAESMAIPNKKVKKPSFFKRWMLKAIKEAVDAERQTNSIVGSDVNIKQARIGLMSVGPTHIDQPERAIHFTVYVANGGRVIETRRHDRKTDRNTNGLYIITNDQEFGKEIDKIIVMEGLR
jgi:hypothetical protein